MTGTACNGWRFWRLAGERDDGPLETEESAATRPTLPDVSSTADGSPTTPAAKTSADSGATARPAAKRAAAPKANGSKAGKPATGTATGCKTVRTNPTRTAKAVRR